jgi:hypothetical protein
VYFLTKIGFLTPDFMHYGSVKEVMEAKNEELIKLIGKSKTLKIKKS